MKTINKIKGIIFILMIISTFALQYFTFTAPSYAAETGESKIENKIVDGETLKEDTKLANFEEDASSDIQDYDNANDITIETEERNVDNENNTENNINTETSNENNKPNIKVLKNKMATLLGANNTNIATTDESNILKNYDHYAEIMEDTENEWYVKDSYGTIKFYKLNYRTNKTTLAYTYEFDRDKFIVLDYYTNGTTIYALISDKNSDYKPTIIGYDVKQNKIVFNQSYEGTRQYVLNKQFIVDGEQRVYFEDEKDIKTYDKNGKLISTFINEDKINFSLQNINPNNKIIAVSVNYSYDGFLKVEDGVIKSKKITRCNYKGYGYRYVSWKFLTNTLAIDTYGAVAEFDYSSDEISYKVKYAKERKVVNNPALKKDNYIYIGENDGYVFKVNLDTIIIEGRYTLKNTNARILSINYSNNTYYVRYVVEESDDNYTYYLESFKEKDIKKPDTHILTENTAKNHSKNEIVNKYKQAKAKFDYSTSVYKKQPSTSSPYDAGELQEQVKQDTLNQVNFYRWLYGISNVTINTERLDRNQKGATLLAVNKQLTHYPSKPDDMDDDFYKEAYLGCNAELDYSGCVGKGSSMPGSIYSYIDDSNNVMQDVGHRTNILDLAADSISFGYCSPYNTLSTYYSTNKVNNDSFYTYPTAGYFPVECINTKALWSITLKSNNYMFKGYKIKFTCDGKTVESPYSKYVAETNTLTFNLPSEIKELAYNGNTKYLAGKKISLEVSGIQDDIGDNYIIKYNVEFIGIEADVLPTSAIISFNNSIFSNTSSTEIKEGETKKLYVAVRPSNATNQRYNVKVTSNDGAISYNSDTYEIKALKPGKAHLQIISVATGKVLHEFDVIVPSKEILATNLSLSKTNTTLYVGYSETITATVSPSDATNKTVTWSSSNTGVATVSNGKITGKKAGTATITAKTSNGKTATCKVTVKEKTINVTGINLNKTSTTINVGNSETITATVTPSNATNKTVTWSSSNTGVATVNNGKITGKKAGTATITAKTSNGKTATCKVTVKTKTNSDTDTSINVPNVLYRTHVQNEGWQSYVKNGAMSGTQGKSLRLEGINIHLENVKYNGDIEYSTHVQNIGWQGYAKNGKMSGTQGQSLRLEAIKIRLTGELAKHYDIYYRVHAQDTGWMNWAKNDEPAGSAGYSYRLEGIEIVVVEKGKNPPTRTNIQYNKAFKCHTIAYRTHVQDVGWQNYVYDGAMSGTSGRSLRLEGINIKLENKKYDGDIEYCTHVQNVGWQSYVKNGAMSGTSGKGWRLEAIKIRLTGKMAEKYDIYYRVHCQNIGWMGWAKNGESAGTAGYSYRLEGINIVLVEKGGSAPGSTNNHFKENK